MARPVLVSSDPQTGNRPRIVTALGKQKSGKSLFLRWWVERKMASRNRPLRLIDADPHNDTLHQHYESALTPESSALEDRRVYLEQATREQALAARKGDPYDAIWDVGGGDFLMSRLAHEIKFTETVERVGMDLIVFYMLSPSLSDLEYFQTLEDAGFHPARLGLVFNAGLIQGDRQPSRAFASMVETPLVRKLLERGAQPLFLVPLAADCVEAVDATGAKTFGDAIHRLQEDPLLNFGHETRLLSWLDKMEVTVGQKLDELGWWV